MKERVEYSPLQQRIFDFVGDRSRVGESAAVIAVAGSGKTTTIVQAVNHIDPQLSILMLAFNNSICKELEKRVNAEVKVSTFHSLAYRVLRKKYPHMRLLQSKIQKIISSTFSDTDWKTYRHFVARLISLSKQHGVGYFCDPNDRDNYQYLIEHHDLVLVNGNLRRAIDLTMEVLERSLTDTTVCDFDDMLYMPLIEDLSFPRYDFVFVDEAQDTNAVQVELLTRVLAESGDKVTGRLIAVGDPCQSIYGWRGAATDAMSKLIENFNCIELPLSISYRCAKAIVRKAQEYVSYIEYAPHAQEGEVGRLDRFTIEDFTERDAILCRVNAPLFQLALWFIKQKVPVCLLGRAFGQTLILLIKKMHAVTLADLKDKLDEWYEEEYERLILKNQEYLIPNLEDKINSIRVLMDNLEEKDRTVDGLIDCIDSLLQNTENCLTLSTVHKAKGKEWDNVFILDRSKYMPSRWAKSNWMKQQERCIIYVATTRARTRLFDIESVARTMDD